MRLSLAENISVKGLDGSEFCPGAFRLFDLAEDGSFLFLRKAILSENGKRNPFPQADLDEKHVDRRAQVKAEAGQDLLYVSLQGVISADFDLGHALTLARWPDKV